MINLEQFNEAVINPDDNSLTIGGATSVDTLIDAAFSAGRELSQSPFSSQKRISLIL
jgi:hypothetical protein